MFTKSCMLAATLCLLPSIHAEPYALIFRDIAKPVTLNVPQGFTLAKTPQAQERRNLLIESIRSNPAYKGKCDEVFMADWSQDLPCIMVGGFGAAAKSQGKVSSASWAKLRKQLLEATPEQIKVIRSVKIAEAESAGQSAPDKREELEWLENQNDPNAVIIVTHSRLTNGGRATSTFIGKKLMYHDGFLISATVSVDALAPSALQKLRAYLDALKIHSI